MRTFGMILAMGCCFVSVGASNAFATVGAMLPNSDIRAMVPPIDVTEQQLDAQGYDSMPPLVVTPPLHRHHHGVRRHEP